MYFLHKYGIYSQIYILNRFSYPAKFIFHDEKLYISYIYFFPWGVPRYIAYHYFCIESWTLHKKGLFRKYAVPSVNETLINVYFAFANWRTVFFRKEINILHSSETSIKRCSSGLSSSTLEN